MDFKGIFKISCVEDNLSLHAPMGAGPDFPGPSLECVPEHSQYTAFRVNKLGDDKYEIVSAQFSDYVISYLGHYTPVGDLPFLLQMMPKSWEDYGKDKVYTEWAIEQAGSGEYNIRAASGPGDQYWTLHGGSHRHIKLDGLKGANSQKWRLVWVHDE
ncbi:unnamed protein product [Rhizoctonia solani]|uniref:Uncharacterized protein n=1 Tax=Rhizoctonia solani TaxID=456999 RepID=A0A8H3GM55_9AGAM|nr:unnamed protein product [Rhizoctonia solani]